MTQGCGLTWWPPWSASPWQPGGAWVLTHDAVTASTSMVTGPLTRNKSTRPAGTDPAGRGGGGGGLVGSLVGYSSLWAVMRSSGWPAATSPEAMSSTSAKAAVLVTSTGVVSG